MSKKQKSRSVLATAMGHVREESTADLAQQCHLGMDLAETQLMEVAKMKNGKVVMCNDAETKMAINAVGKVVAVGVSLLVQELQRRHKKNPEDKEVLQALEDIARHAFHHSVRKMANVLSQDEPKRAGDNKRPSEFRVNLDQLKPSDN